MVCSKAHYGSPELESGTLKSKTICLDKLAQALESKVPANASRETSGGIANDSFYNLPVINEGLAQKLPWKNDVRYFRKVYISALALMKMTLHAQSGGSLEVMGMITGKIVVGAIIVMDVYALPVEGTETRVNAQAEGYEYMVQYLEANKKLGNHGENIVGWYHSHPGYGCWLSGIDVSTQSLNQNFQDPYLALVIDPTKTITQNKVEIGAFRTFPDDHNEIKGDAKSSPIELSSTQRKLPKSKRNDFGIHSDKYYSLDIEIFSNSIDANVMAMAMQFQDVQSASWIRPLLSEHNDVSGASRVGAPAVLARGGTNGNVNANSGGSGRRGSANGSANGGTKAGANYKSSLMNGLQMENETMDRIAQLINTLQKWEVGGNSTEFHKKFEQSFESMIYRKLLVAKKSDSRETVRSGGCGGGSGGGGQEIDQSSGLDEYMEDGTQGSEDDESDKEAQVLDVSDMEDAISVESSSVNKNDYDYENEDENGEASDVRLAVAKRERRSFMDDARRTQVQSLLSVPRDQTRTRARSPGKSLKFVKPSAPDATFGKFRPVARQGVYEEEHKLKKTGGRNVGELARLATHIGQREVQELITHDIQTRLFM